MFIWLELGVLSVKLSSQCSCLISNQINRTSHHVRDLMRSLGTCVAIFGTIWNNPIPELTRFPTLLHKALMLQLLEQRYSSCQFKKSDLVLGRGTSPSIGNNDANQ